MKITELSGVQQYYHKSLDDLIQLITKPGAKFSPAGHGMLAKVFAHDSGIVYKFWVKL